MADAPIVSLVVPIHHCDGQLGPQLDALVRFKDEAPVPVELVIVDDHGTKAGTTELLTLFARQPGVILVRNDRNRGKGHSVARGMLAASGAYRVFTDSDLAYPLSQVWNIVSALEKGADVAIACRVHPQSKYVMNAGYLRYIYTRHVMSRIFNAFVRATLIPGVRDTQAGLKGYTASAAQRVFSRVRIAGFGFDLESLFIARQLGLKIEQVPVTFRYNDEPTTVRFLRDGRRMAADLARIRIRGWSGEYRAVTDETLESFSAAAAGTAYSAGAAKDEAAPVRFSAGSATEQAAAVPFSAGLRPGNGDNAAPEGQPA